MPEPPPSEPKLGLDQISTRWSSVNDPLQFVYRYAPAIRKYLEALLKNDHDAEEVAQDFLLRVVQHGFAHATPERGRFRDYLKKSVRNCALTYLRRKQAHQHDDFERVQYTLPAEGPDPADGAWIAEWQRCVLGRAWRALDSHERRSPGNLFHTVLRLAADHPADDSETLAARTSQQIGRPLRSDAFRKQLSRARHRFAELLLEEVTQTLEQPSRENVEAELIELGLMPYVRDFLPDDWHAPGSLPNIG